MFEKWTPQCCSDGRGSRGSVGAARPAGRDGLHQCPPRMPGSGVSAADIDSEPEIEETASINVPQGSRLSEIEGQLQEMAAARGSQGSSEAWLAPPPVFIWTFFSPPPAGSPGSGVGRLDGWLQVPPAVTHEGPMPMVVWLARMNPPHFRCLADWLDHLEWVGFIHRCDVIVLTGRYDLATV